MRRPITQMLDARRTLPLAIAALAVASVLPGRWLGWAGWFGTLTQTIVAPISHPVTRFSRWLSPAAPRPAGEDGPSREWRLRAQEYEALYLRQRDENLALRDVIRQLQSGVAHSPGLGVRQLAAPVIGAGSDLASRLLAVRVPRDSAITTGTSIAVAEGVQLVGRVDSLRGPIAQIRPITAESAGRIEAVIMLGDAHDAPRLLCSLTPVGDGTLRGPVEDPGAPTPGLEPAPGQRVRLADRAWPESAQQLLVGVVERVEPNPAQPLRRMVVVRPIADLARLSEVVLRIPLWREDADPPPDRGPP